MNFAWFTQNSELRSKGTGSDTRRLDMDGWEIHLPGKAEDRDRVEREQGIACR
jgi:hypothetical protein